MRLILLAGVAATLSISAQFTLAETPADRTEESRALSSTGRHQVKWFLGGPGPRVLPLDEFSGSRLTKLSEVDLLAQLIVVNSDVHRYGVHIGGRNLPGAQGSLERPKSRDESAGDGPSPTGDASKVVGPPTLTPWVVVVRTAAGGVERQTLAVARVDMQEGWASTASALKTVLRTVRVQREYAFKSDTEFVNVIPPAAAGDGPIDSLVVMTSQGSGTFDGGDLTVGSIIGFWATLDRLTVVTTARARYDFDITAHEGQLRFAPAGRGSIADPGRLLNIETSITPAQIVRRVVKCNADLGGAA